MTRVVCVLCVAALSCPVAAAAQATVIVNPAVHLEAAHDSNILWRPQAREDDIWRLSPSLQIQRDTPRSSWRGDGSLDAEWYARHPDLSTPLARQHAALSGHVRATERVRFEVNGAFDSGIRPAELNLATGLAPGRVRGTRWVGGAGTGYAITPRTQVALRGQATGEETEVADAFIQDGELRLQHNWDDRNGVHARYLAEYFTFDPGSIASHVVAAGWTRRITSSIQLELEGGVRRALGGFRPEIEASATYRRQYTDVRLRYAWTQATALGVLGLVEARAAIFSVRHIRPQVVSISLDGAAYFNTLDDERTDVYRVAAEILKPVIGPLAIAAAWSFDHHRGLFVSGIDAGPGIPVPGSTPANQFTRQVVLVRMVVSGSVRSMAGPREPGTVRPGEGEGDR